MRYAWIAMKLSLLAGCSVLPMGCMSPQCRAEMDRCLQSCEPRESSPVETSGDDNDSRGECETRCHRRCTYL